QLFRYFTVTTARIAILTNGNDYRFYTDLDAPNKMDSQPFLELQLDDLDSSLFPELEKLRKSNFDLESVLSAAEELKYVSAAKREDRKSTRLNSSHVSISYAVFCLKKKTESAAILQLKPD